MHAIAFTGFARSGKDTAADYVAEKYGFEKIVMSDWLTEKLARQGREDTKINHALIGKELRDEFGSDIVAKKVFEKAQKNGFEKILVVGPRSVSEIEFFKKNIPNFVLIAIESAKGKRFGRRSNKDEQTKESFFKRDKYDSEKFELGKVIGLADHIIENNSTIDEFQKAIDGLMQNI